MKNLTNLLLSSLFLLSITFISCNDNSTDPELEADKNYFPNKEGSVYKYDLEITDSLGTSFNSD